LEDAQGRKVTSPVTALHPLTTKPTF